MQFKATLSSGDLPEWKGFGDIFIWDCPFLCFQAIKIIPAQAYNEVSVAYLQVIAAEGEKKASGALREASEIISESPAALQLRYLQVTTSRDR